MFSSKALRLLNVTFDLKEKKGPWSCKAAMAICVPLCLYGLEHSSAQEVASRIVPSRVIPVPSSVSPEMQKVLAQTSGPDLPPPKSTAEWKALSGPEGGRAPELAALRQKLGVTVVSQEIGKVPCYIVTPKVIERRNRNRLILNIHYGGWIWGGGEFGTDWAMNLADLAGIKVIEVDYRLLPDNLFPAAIDDVTEVYRHLIKVTKPSDIAVIGGSVGGGMVLSLVQRAKQVGLPLPGAIVSMSPAAADLSKTGDSFYTNAGVDGTVIYDGLWEAVFRLYANGHDLRDPAVSPLYGEFGGFPPTYLVSGTRDLFLSDTVRVQQKLLNANVATQLEVVEGLPHGGVLMTNIPEVAQVHVHVAQFLDAHLGR